MELLRCQAALLDTNSYLVIDDQGSRFFAVDPTTELLPKLQEFHERGYNLDSIVLTHGHFDHISGCSACKELWPGAVLRVHHADAGLLSDPARNLSSVFLEQLVTAPSPDLLVDDGEEFVCVDRVWRVVHTPGHTRGSICLQGEGWLFTGDTLFCAGVGRTDVPGGSAVQLRDSLQRLSRLPRHLLVYPGHGPHCPLGEALERIEVDW